MALLKITNVKKSYNITKSQKQDVNKIDEEKNDIVIDNNEQNTILLWNYILLCYNHKKKGGVE